MIASNLKPWDGTAYGMTYTEGRGLMIDPTTGCIYYTDYSGRVCVWCAPNRLYDHMCKLARLVPNSVKMER